MFQNDNQLIYLVFLLVEEVPLICDQVRLSILQWPLVQVVYLPSAAWAHNPGLFVTEPGCSHDPVRITIPVNLLRWVTLHRRNRMKSWQNYEK